MHDLKGWTAGETMVFRTMFLFDDEEDFLASMLPDCREQAESFIAEVRRFLDQHRTPKGILLDANRRMNLMRPETKRALA